MECFVHCHVICAPNRGPNNIASIVLIPVQRCCMFLEMVRGFLKSLCSGWCRFDYTCVIFQMRCIENLHKHFQCCHHVTSTKYGTINLSPVQGTESVSIFQFFIHLTSFAVDIVVKFHCFTSPFSTQPWDQGSGSRITRTPDILP